MFFSRRAGLQGHVYSLGSTLSAALNFVIEPELEAELGDEIQRLLEQMQEDKPEDRPLLQVTGLHPSLSENECSRFRALGDLSLVIVLSWYLDESLTESLSD